MSARQTSLGRRLRAVLASACVLFGVAGAARAEAPPSVIRIGVAGEGLGGRQYSARLTLDIVRAQGLLEKEFGPSTQIRWIYFKGAGPAVSEAMAGHQIDFAYHGDLPEVILRGSGVKTRFLMPLYARNNEYVAVPSGSNLKTLKDLKGHTVADFRGVSQELMAARILSTAGLTERDLKLVNLDIPATNAALATGRIDAAFVSFMSFGLLDQKLIRYLYATNWSPRFTSLGALVVSDDFARKYPQTVDRVVKQMVVGAAFAARPENRDAVFQIWGKSGIPVDYFSREYKGQDLKVVLSPLTDDFVVAHYKDVASDALKFGLVRKAVDLNGWFDPGPVSRAIAALHLNGVWAYDDASGRPKGRT